MTKLKVSFNDSEDLRTPDMMEEIILPSGVCLLDCCKKGYLEEAVKTALAYKGFNVTALFKVYVA